VSAFVKTSLYVLFMVAMFCVEHEVPVMLYTKRVVFLANWKVATFAQRRAISSYRSYQKEAEMSHG
jgi:hypothetical protein